jgi:serine/threonine-protein kinase
MSPHSHSADRNLLLGIIALQMDFISRDQLIAAIGAWILDKHKSLGQLLSEQGVLSHDEHEAIETLVRHHLLRHDNDVERSLASLSSIGQRLRDDLSRIADPDMQASLPLISSGRGDNESTLSYVGSPTTPGGRFRILRPHAQGGLGVVSVALDEELHREVALKEIQERFASDVQPRARFLLEAEITGGLEHPGIVPVYGLGHHPDGRPFYAMRFVRGENLKEAVGRYHASGRSGGAAQAPGRRPLTQAFENQPKRRSPVAGARAIPTHATKTVELRRLLSRFLDVCNAIAYAHSRGVLHRDIKPGNILLGPYGETLVVDWGLAKILGRDESAESEPSAEPTLRPPSASGTGETVPGTALGTPAYMSPEQAEGRLDLLGPQSDVYSLGATLYVVLTGRAPFDGGDAAEILPMVQRGEFARPRAVDASIPKSLESICLKAMSLKQSDRYQSPRALAEEIEHWLADEPVSAYCEPLMDRARRWSRRHRTPVTSGAAVLMLGLLGSVGFAAVVTGKNRELAKQTRRAEEREQMAIDAVSRFRDVVVGEPALKNDPALQDLRRKLLSEPLAFFQSLRAQLQADKDTRADALARLAAAGFELARLMDEIGNKREALRYHKESLAIRAGLARKSPRESRFLSDLARSHLNIGIVQRATGNVEGALESYSNARAIFAQLARENPSVTEFQRDVAASDNNIGNVQHSTGHPDQALESYGRALAVRERFARENPRVTDFQSQLAASHFNLGSLENDGGGHDQALESFGKALAIYERLAREYPDVTEFQSNLAKSYDTIGEVQTTTGDSESALASCGRALAIRQRLARDNPSVTEFQNQLALSHNIIGAVETLRGHPKPALESYGKALAIFERLARENPAATDFKSALAMTCNNMGAIEALTGRPDQAMESYRKALAADEQLARGHPESPRYASDVGGTLNNMAALDLNANRFEQARERLNQARSWQKKALASFPNNPTYRQFLRKHLMNLVRAAKALGYDGEARAAQHELDELAANDPARIALDQRLTAVVRGEVPKDNRERLTLASRAYEKKFYAAAARFFDDALEADPKLAEDRQSQYRYNAACAAALAAASGTGPPARKETSGRTEKPFTDADRAKFRNQARAWLEAELATWTKILGSASSQQRQAIAGILKHWQEDTDLVSVRDEAALAKLPDDERKAWQSLWSNVDVLLTKARKP